MDIVYKKLIDNNNILREALLLACEQSQEYDGTKEQANYLMGILIEKTKKKLDKS